jgi:predicted nucleic acid-binding protein
MPKRKVVVNSSPIIALSAIHQLNLFKELYSEIFIPKAVHDEVLVKKDSQFLLSFEQAKDWIITKTVTNNEAKKFFKVQLHDGEVEVMLLGRELGAELLVIDDYIAREYAKYLDFKVTGTLGIILKAKENRIIKEVKPLLINLMTNGIYIGDNLFQDILKIAEEN